MKDLLPRLQRHRTAQHLRTPLERAAVLAACHDLLTGVAALLEVHATDQFEVDHLRHELLGCRRHHAGHAAGGFQTAPEFDVQRRQGRRCDTGPQTARHGVACDNRIGQADQISITDSRLRPGFGSRHARSDQTPQGHISRRVAELAFGAQHEHGQALEHGRQQVRAAGQQDVVTPAPGHEGRQQPTLGRTETGQMRTAGLQMLHVLRQLAVQKARRFGTGGADHAPVVQPDSAFNGGQGGGSRVHAVIIMR